MPGPFGHGREHPLGGALAEDGGRRLIGIELSLGDEPGEDSHLFDLDAVDFGHLAQQERDVSLVGELHHEFVHGAPVAAAHDVHRHDIGSHSSDAAGDGTEGPWSVGQTHPEQERSHTGSLGKTHEQSVSAWRRRG